MSEQKNTAAQRVEVYIPRGSVSEDPNLYVSINGVNYLLPKGKTSLVPAHVKAEIDRCNAARVRAEDNAAAMAAGKLPGQTMG